MSKNSKTLNVAIILTGITLLFIATWLSTACIDYTTRCIFPFKSAGHFFLAIPFIAGASFAYSFIFCLIARFSNKKIGWMLLIVCSITLIILAVTSNLPSKSIERAFGVKLPDSIMLVSLRTMDSFNDGMVFVGELYGESKDMSNFIDSFSIETGDEYALSRLQQYFKETNISEHGKTYILKDRNGCIYRDETQNKLYFLIYSR
ncbi:MAG: hypothetical protein PF692_09930 [Kiritimatiellae bacterium]|jgi:hypothetical protein|nr:hypothetical protein [Kiritimatiellia bacterium]